MASKSKKPQGNVKGTQNFRVWAENEVGVSWEQIPRELLLQLYTVYLSYGRK